MKRQQMTWRLRLTFCIVIIGAILTSCGPSKVVLATQTTIAATATFEALPTATLTRTPTAIPTLTLTPTETPTKSPPPKPTRTERPTPTENPIKPPEKWGNDWIKNFFIPADKQQELRDTEAIILTDIPYEKWKDLKITGPGQAYMVCPGKKTKERLGGYILTQINFDLFGKENNFCFIKAATNQQVITYIKNNYPSASPTIIQKRVEAFIRASQALVRLIPDDDYYLDAYLSLGLDIYTKRPDTMVWRLFSIKDGVDAYVFIRELPLPK